MKKSDALMQTGRTNAPRKKQVIWKYEGKEYLKQIVQTTPTTTGTLKQYWKHCTTFVMCNMIKVQTIVEMVCY